MTPPPAQAYMPGLSASNTCCGGAAERAFERNGFRPQKVVSVDQENVTRTLIAGGVGIGLLHADTAREVMAKGEMEVVYGVQQEVEALLRIRRGRP